ncbi:MAG: methyl-accepting chemotaxis protein [Anaerocolumna sp.]
MSKYNLNTPKDLDEISVINKIAINVMTAFSLLLIAGYIAEVIKKNRSAEYVATLSAIILVSLAVDYIFYFRNKGGAVNPYVFLGAFLVTYVIALFTSTTHLGFVYFIPLLIILILYGDMKLIYLSCAAFALSGFGEIAYKAMVLHMTEQTDVSSYSIEAAVILISSYCFMKAAFANKYFLTKFKQGLMEEKSVQETLLKDVHDIAAAVKTGSDKMSGIVDTIDQSTKVVTTAVNEIAMDTTENAGHIQDQSTMATLIQDSIHNDGEQSTTRVHIAENSEKALVDGITIINKLQEQSSLVERINQEVISTMATLQDKTNEVLDITSIIYNISSQTNLLALNASIESARAGEAGKGFSAVAEQIRMLAEQTRESTESISSILEELTRDSGNSVASAEQITQVSNKQVNMSAHAGSGFEGVKGMMADLTGIIMEIDSMIDDLYHSNNHIVDNFVHLSSVTEEITANSQAAANLCIDNVNNSSSVKNIVSNLLSEINKFNKYFNEA